MRALVPSHIRTVSVAPIGGHTTQVGPCRVEEVYGRETWPCQPTIGAQGHGVPAQLVQEKPDRGRKKRGVGQGRRLVQPNAVDDRAVWSGVGGVEDRSA